MTAVTIELPPKLVPVFDGSADYRGAYGGRGSAKTTSFALMFSVFGYVFGQSGKRGMMLGCREFMNSIEDSSFQEVKSAILSADDDGEYKYPWLVDYYEIGQNFIRSKDKAIRFGFCGLRHNVDSVKGKHKILIAWVDEAEPVSKMAWDKLDATIREDDSELWVTWNPESEESETDNRFRKHPPPNSKIVEINWSDNPWFPSRLDRVRQHKQKTDPEDYLWEWEGHYKTRSDAQIFAGKYTIKDFEPADDWSGPYFGLDWGFAKDPTAGVKCWIHGNKLYIEHEAGQVGLELDDTADYMIARLPDIENHVIRADCARPESISFVQRNGLNKIRAAKKWSGSVQDGINHMRSYDEIVIHPRCEMTAREFRLYSYKIDRLSGDILPVVIDLHNHFIDSIRYAIEPIIGVALERKKQPSRKQEKPVDAWGRVKRGGGDSWTTV